MIWNYIVLALIVIVCSASCYVVGWLNGVVYGIAFGDARHGN